MLLNHVTHLYYLGPLLYESLYFKLFELTKSNLAHYIKLFVKAIKCRKQIV